MQTSGFYAASTTTTFLYFNQSDENTPPTSKSIPIESSSETPVSIPVRLPVPIEYAADAAVKIQSVYRSHLVRALVRRILAVDTEAGRFEGLIRLQETVDAVRRDERERLRVSEGLLALLLRLDSVPGFYPSVRELRRSVSHRIVGLQEVLDAITEERICGLEGFPSSWEEVVCGVGGEGGGGRGQLEAEERFDERGLRCLERFLLGVLI